MNGKIITSYKKTAKTILANDSSFEKKWQTLTEFLRTLQEELLLPDTIEVNEVNYHYSVVDVFKNLIADLLKIIKEVSKIIGLENINVELTALNLPTIILNTQQICIEKDEYEKLLKMGYDFNFGCVAACGFGQFRVYESTDKICFEVVPCMCHPDSYFLVLQPITKS